MGMFAYVRHEADCVKCGLKITNNWQTKDLDDLYLQTVEPEDVRCFYAICPECSEWNEFEVVPTAYEIRRVDAA